MSVLIIFIKLIAVFDLLVIAVYFGGDIFSTMLNKLRRKPKQDDPFDFSLDTVTVSLSIDSIRQNGHCFLRIWQDLFFHKICRIDGTKLTDRIYGQ